MEREEELKREDDIWSFDSIKKYALTSFDKWRKKNEKYIFIAAKKFLLDQAIANYC